MIKNMFIKKYFLVLAIMMSLLFIFGLGNKKIRADGHVDGQVNLDLWNYELIDDPDVGNKKLVKLKGYTEDASLKDIVVPNANDFLADSAFSSVNSENVDKISRAGITFDALRSAGAGANKPGGSLSISQKQGNADRSVLSLDDLSDPKLEKHDSCDEGAGFYDGEGVFKGYKNIESINLYGLDTSNVEDMSYMFCECNSLTNLNLSSFDTSKVKDMGAMFSGCSNLEQLDLSSFDTSAIAEHDYNTHSDGSQIGTNYWNIHGMACMFSGCSSLIDLKIGDNFDISNSTSTKAMFKSCKIKDSSLFSNWKTSNVEYMYGMYADFFGNGDLYLGNFDSPGSAKLSKKGDNIQIGEMFKGSQNVLYLDLSSLNLSKSDDYYNRVGVFKTGAEKKEPLLITVSINENYSESLRKYSNYQSDCRELFITTLKVDGDKVKFKDLGDEGEYNEDRTEKYINIYDEFTTTDNKEQILQKLKDRLKAEENNLIIADGYEFNEWKPEKDYEGKVSYSLGGIYTAIVEGKGTIIFDANGGNGTMPNQLLVSNKSTVLNKNTFTKEGYDFVTWNTEANGSGKSYSDQEKITLTLDPGKILTLYAQWEKKTEKPKTTGENYYSWNAISNSSGGTSQNLSPVQIDKTSNEDKLIENKTLRNIELPERLKTRKYLIGYSDGKINPNGTLTHAELATVIYKLMNNGEDINYNNLSGLNDVKTSDWFAMSASYLLDKNIIKITDNKFSPNEVITRGEVAEILFNVFKFYDRNNNNYNYDYAYGNASYNFIDENEFEDFTEAIKQLASNGIINGYENNKFEPNKYITRGELAKIIFMAFQRKYNPGKEIYYDLEKNNWAYNFLIDASE